MSAALFMILAQMATPQRPPAPGVAAAAADAAMPELRFRRRAEAPAGYIDFVRDEVRAGHCPIVPRADGALVVTIDMAVLVANDGTVRRIVPRPVGCPTVEQYATGLVERMARDNLDPGVGERDGWFHTALEFAWR